MCPTELLYDPSRPPMIELLPIETRTSNSTVSEYKNYPEEWSIVSIDTSSPESVTHAMQEVCRVKSVPVTTAVSYGLYDPTSPDASFALNEAGEVVIPAWRHAVINFPHPFLEKGLVVPT